MTSRLRVLVLEDRPADAELMLEQLRRHGFEVEWERVDTEEAYAARLDAGWDVILADYTVLGFDGLRALALRRDREIDVPFIIVSGTLSDEAAVTCLQAGAAAYLSKDRLARLGAGWDLILADYRLPAFDAVQALILRHDRGLDIPVIIVSGSIGEEAAVACLQYGAAAYLSKDRLRRLGPAGECALEGRRLREEKRRAEEESRRAAETLRAVLDTLPVGVWIADAAGKILEGDEEAVRSLAAEVLITASGYEVLEASDVTDALRIAERHPGPIHLLVTDVIMPLMSGPELAGRVAALRPEIRVLFVSGYTCSALSCHERLGPGTPLLAKPFTPDGLARAVRQVLNGGG